MKSKEKLEPVVTFTMADGTVRDSIEGVKVPRNKFTEVAYQILENFESRPTS